MTPKEKAQDLIHKYKHDFYRYYVASYDEIKFSKIGALIAVDEILNLNDAMYASEIEQKKFWQEVKKEIELF